MLKLLIGAIFLIIGFVLYCCLCCASSYDKEIDDIEQEKFLKEWK